MVDPELGPKSLDLILDPTYKYYGTIDIKVQLEADFVINDIFEKFPSFF